MIKKILFITLSNIGDVILTLPLLDRLRDNFPQAQITVMVGPRPKEIFENNPCISELIIYDKHSSLKSKIQLFHKLNNQHFDVVVDLRNSFYGSFLSCKYRTSPFLSIPKSIRHMKDRHLYKAKGLKLKAKNFTPNIKSLNITKQDEEYINRILVNNQIKQDNRFVVIAPGARSHIKRWPKERFVKLARLIIDELGFNVVLVGDSQDLPRAEFIRKNVKSRLTNFSAQTNISQLAALLKRADALITNDSAVLHLGSYLNIASVAIFGPTNQSKYGPWSEKNRLVYKSISCRPCEEAQCRFNSLDCMKMIQAEDVFKSVKELLKTQDKIQETRSKYDFKRILIVRTDRIGDVLLSTPVISALRDNFPQACIAMMVRPYAYEIVKGNPFLDEVIVYDKYARHKNWLNSFRFALRLRKKRFDLAMILHPTNRAHLITFFAGIRRRIGYDRKLGFLLTDRLKHSKQRGEKHELEYSLDLIKYLGIEPLHKQLFMPISEDAELWVRALFRSLGIGNHDELLAVHPGASCPSKIWPAERFAAVCDRLVDKYGFKVIVLAGPQNRNVANELVGNMKHTAINLCGKTSLSKLASLLKRCKLFISNDSGPVHIACAVETPVISIFGRNQKGLSPLRWAPLGKKDKVLHREVGCQECLAHNCLKEFACLKAITIEDVLGMADTILKES